MTNTPTPKLDEALEPIVDLMLTAHREQRDFLASETRRYLAAGRRALPALEAYVVDNDIVIESPAEAIELLKARALALFEQRVADLGAQHHE